MTVWFTSDLHFNHKNILNYESSTRPFESLEEHNETLINNWNSVVQEDDDVYVLGDFIMGSADGIDPILTSLKGNIHLVRGNHDTNNKLSVYAEYGIDIHDIMYIEYNGVWFILCHFPIDSEDMRKMLFGRERKDKCCLLYGHVHHNAPHGMFNRTFHVGVDTNNLTPISLEDIYHKYMKEVSIF